MAASKAAHRVAAAVLVAALLLPCAASTSAPHHCNSPKMCDDSCHASTVVRDCIKFIGDLSDVKDLAMEAVNGALIFRKLKVVTGDVSFSRGDIAGVRRVSFPKLLVTGGDFEFSNLDEVEAIDAPFLKQVAEFDIYDMNGLEKLIMPSLQGADNGFSANNNDNLKYMAFPLLQVANENFEVNDNLELEKADFPTFKILNGDDDDGIEFESNPKLKHVYFPSLETISAAGVRVVDNTELKTVNFPRLKYAVSDNEEVEIKRNAELEFINIPALKSAYEVDIDDNAQLKVAKVGSNIDAGTVIGQEVLVTDNPELKWFNMAGMKALEDSLEVEDNGKLNWISAEGLEAIGDEVIISGNALSGLWLPNLKVVGEGIEVSDDEEIKFISMPKILDMDVDTGTGIEVENTPKLELISAISMKNGDELELDGDGLGNLKLVNFPSMISNTGEILLGNNDQTSDSFKGTAFFPKLLAAKDGITADESVTVVAPKLANDIESDSFKGTAFTPSKLLAAEDGITADEAAAVVVPKLANDIERPHDNNNSVEAEVAAEVLVAAEKAKGGARRLLSARE